MTNTAIQPNIQTDENLSRDACFEILSNQRRRFALHYLKRHNGEWVPVSDLVERITSWENNKSEDDITSEERRRVQTAMHQYHLPKMTEHGFVKYDPNRREVALTSVAANTEFYVEALPNHGIPWGEYYIGLTGVTIVGLGGIVLGLYPFSLLTPFLWCIFVITMFTTSALAHLYDTRYRMRLGARKIPPEVESI